MEPDVGTTGIINVVGAVLPKPVIKRAETKGKRWVRRNDNARFSGNPYIVLASKSDYLIEPPNARRTFPEPLPPFIQRTAKLPSTLPPAVNVASANAGRFSLSLKGMRRELRKSGYRTQVMVQEIEQEIMDWLRDGGTIIAPDSSQGVPQLFRPIGHTGGILEVARTPLQLTWQISDDSFARYIVHCCARYHDVVSFSKEVTLTPQSHPQKFTYLLRPNVRAPLLRGQIHGIDTPPVTDIDISSQFDTESEFASSDHDHGTYSDAESDTNLGHNAPGGLSVISEASITVQDDGDLTIVQIERDRDSSLLDYVEYADGEGGESESDASLSASIDSLSIDPASHSLLSISPLSHPRMIASRRQIRHNQPRSASSPSRSPARPYRRPQQKFGDFAQTRKATFYNYLYS